MCGIAGFVSGEWRRGADIVAVLERMSLGHDPHQREGHDHAVKETESEAGGKRLNNTARDLAIVE